jgi:hypothetical protein
MLSHRCQPPAGGQCRAQGETIEDVLVAYRRRLLQGRVLSKIDEAVKLGPALDALIRHRSRCWAVANGQRVPEDWHRLSAQALVQRALRGGGSAAWKLDSRRREPGVRRPSRSGARPWPAPAGWLPPEPEPDSRHDPATIRLTPAASGPGRRPQATVRRPGPARAAAGGQPIRAGVRCIDRGGGGCAGGQRAAGAGGRRGQQRCRAARDRAVRPGRQHRHLVAGSGLPGSARPAAGPCRQPRLGGGLCRCHRGRLAGRPMWCCCTPTRATWPACWPGARRARCCWRRAAGSRQAGLRGGQAAGAALPAPCGSTCCCRRARAAPGRSM